MILLDTNAVIWIDQKHPRARPLLRARQRLYISPASLLELQFLEEASRIRLRGNAIASIVADDRWMLDDPPAAAWFQHAIDLAWTRDPFDRLIVAHAQLRRWRLATGDARLVAQLAPAGCLEL
jgi:PIN domain nuclease of toxin-antitoxin system